MESEAFAASAHWESFDGRGLDSAGQVLCKD
jgi:hypothetical protein